MTQTQMKKLRGMSIRRLNQKACALEKRARLLFREAAEISRIIVDKMHPS